MEMQRTTSWKKVGFAMLGLSAMGAWVAGVPETGWTQVLSQTWSRPNFSVPEAAIVGDVNGDGYDDALLRIQNRNNTSGVYLYLGSSSGLASSPAWSVEAATGPRSDAFGDAIASAGDVDGDGYNDVVIGDPKGGQIGPSGVNHEGRAYLYRGSPSGLETTPSWSTTGAATAFGADVAGGSDVDGDGYDDVIVGAPGTIGTCRYNSTNQTLPSGVYVYRGSSSGLPDTANWSKRADKTGVSWKSTTPRSQGAVCLGWSVGMAGDVDGDGYGDTVAVSSDYRNPSRSGNRGWGDGRAFVFQGSPSGLGSTPSWSRAHPDIRPKGIGSLFIGTVRGDVNGDDYDDLVLLGAGDYRETRTMRMFVFHGTASGLKSNYHQFIERPDDVLPAPEGDVDDDGYDDLTAWTAGRTISLFHGSKTGVIKPPAWSTNKFDGRGSVKTISTGGDVDGDGHDDLLIGWEGAGAYLLRGGPNPAPTAQNASITVEQNGDATISFVASDPAGDPLTYAIESRPEHGTLGSVDPSGEVRYFPDDGYTGPDRFEFRVEDPYGGSDTATIDVSVKPPNEPPEFVPPTPEERLRATVGEALTFRLRARDPDGDDLTYGVEPMPNGASFDARSGEFEWTPSPRRAGDVEEFQLIADDGRERVTRTIPVEVQAAPGADAGRDASSCRDAGRCEIGDVGTESDGDDADGSTAPPPEADADADSDRMSTSDADGPDTDLGADVRSEAPGRSGAETGCGCTATSRRDSLPLAAFLGLVGVFWFGRRRRRR